MKTIIFLVKDPNRSEYKKYTEYFKDCNVHFIKLTFDTTVKKSSISFMKEQIKEFLLSKIEEYNPDALVICDAGYFKAFTGLIKAEPYLGYACPTRTFKDSKIYNAFYAPTAEQIFYSPSTVMAKVDIALKAVQNKINDSYIAPGSNIIKYEQYPQSEEEIKIWIDKLYEYPALTCDIETRSLKFYKTTISTITFCWNQESGIAFCVGHNNNYVKEQRINQYLKEFFMNYQGKLIFHNIAFDATVLISTLWNTENPDLFLEQRNSLICKGLKYILKNFDDTKLISYLALNSCTRQSYSLKDLAQEFAGNYAQESIDNIDKIPTEELLRYNLIDGLSTWYVYNKNYPKMIKDDQKDIYENIFKPATVDIIHMQLAGMPLNEAEVFKTAEAIDTDLDNIIKEFKSFVLVQTFNNELAHKWADARNSILKKKKVTYEEAPEFNINSNTQLQDFLYNFLELPIIEYTESKQPSTGADTLSKLKNHTSSEDIKKILQLLVDYKAAYKIRTAFIPNFLEANKRNDEDDTLWLHGNFNLGGTVSGRLSSSGPNLQQIPATGSKYAKVIKKCFQAPKDWLFVGLDYSSLEDRISALTTKDPNKLQVYTSGMDGHALRSYHYFKEKMPDIEIAPESEICYKAKVGDTYIYFHDSEIINYFGKDYTGKELYEILTNKKL
mgnify:CR=1 FL=1